MNEAPKLEVLILEDPFNEMFVDVSLNQVCTLLICHPTFLSNFRLLKVVSSVRDYFVVSQHIFDKLITTYFSAFTIHSQKMQFSGIKIAAYDAHYTPNIDPRYLRFKNIEMEDCEFTSRYKATPKAISHWLGHDISVQKSSSDGKSLLFKVKEEADYGCSRKRKYFEIDSDDST